MKSPRKTGFHKLASLLLLAFAAAFATNALAQEPPAAPVPKVPKDVPAQPAPKPQDTQAPANQNLTDSQTTLKFTVNYVFLPVTVKDSSGRLVADLTRNEFRIFDDNVEQRLEFFSAEAFPLSVVILLDRSEEHTSELQSHSFISYAVFCLKKKKT